MTDADRPDPRTSPGLAFELDLTERGYGECFLTVKPDPDEPGRIRVVVNCDDPYYSGERTLTDAELAALAAVVRASG
jgi:hypothetical protein